MTNVVRRFAQATRPSDGARVRAGEMVTDRVYVLFTSVEETLAAIPVATRLADALHARVTVIHFRPIEFAAPLEAPGGLSPVETEEFRTRLQAEDGEAEAAVCLCRDVRAALAGTLRGRCLVVVPRHARWWATAGRWRRALEAAGHLVVVVDGHAHA